MDLYEPLKSKISFTPWWIPTKLSPFSLRPFFSAFGGGGMRWDWKILSSLKFVIASGWIKKSTHLPYAGVGIHSSAIGGWGGWDWIEKFSRVSVCNWNWLNKKIHSSAIVGGGWDWIENFSRVSVCNYKWLNKKNPLRSHIRWHCLLLKNETWLLVWFDERFFFFFGMLNALYWVRRLTFVNYRSCLCY